MKQETKEMDTCHKVYTWINESIKILLESSCMYFEAYICSHIANVSPYRDLNLINLICSRDYEISVKTNQ